jgi:hypothetical protein
MLATASPALGNEASLRAIDALVDHYRAGDTIMELAGRFGISRTTVMAQLNRRAVQRRATAKQWDAVALAAAAGSYADGTSLADIANQHGLDPQTVANRLRRAGTPIRPRRGWAEQPVNPAPTDDARGA